MRKPTAGPPFIGGIIRKNDRGTFDVFYPIRLGAKTERAANMAITKFLNTYPGLPRLDYPKPD